MRQELARIRRGGSRFYRQLEGLEWQHQECWNFWEREGMCKHKNWMKSHRIFTTPERTEQTPSHSKASGGTWWPFRDTGASGYNWEVLKTLWAHKSHPAGCLCRVGENRDPLSTLHFQKLLPVFTIILPYPEPWTMSLFLPFSLIPIEYIYIYLIVWIYIYNSLGIFIHVIIIAFFL